MSEIPEFEPDIFSKFQEMMEREKEPGYISITNGEVVLKEVGEIDAAEHLESISKIADMATRQFMATRQLSEQPRQDIKKTIQNLEKSLACISSPLPEDVEDLRRVAASKIAALRDINVQKRTKKCIEFLKNFPIENKKGSIEEISSEALSTIDDMIKSFKQEEQEKILQDPEFIKAKKDLFDQLAQKELKQECIQYFNAFDVGNDKRSFEEISTEAFSQIDGMLEGLDKEARGKIEKDPEFVAAKKAFLERLAPKAKEQVLIEEFQKEFHDMAKEMGASEGVGLAVLWEKNDALMNAFNKLSPAQQEKLFTDKEFTKARDAFMKLFKEKVAEANKNKTENIEVAADSLKAAKFRQINDIVTGIEENKESYRKYAPLIEKWAKLLPLSVENSMARMSIECFRLEGKKLDGIKQQLETAQQDLGIDASHSFAGWTKIALIAEAIKKEMNQKWGSSISDEEIEKQVVQLLTLSASDYNPIRIPTTEAQEFQKFYPFDQREELYMKPTGRQPTAQDVLFTFDVGTDQCSLTRSEELLAYNSFADAMAYNPKDPATKDKAPDTLLVKSTLTRKIGDTSFHGTIALDNQGKKT